MPINRYYKLYLNAGRAIPLVINVNQYDSGETWYFRLFKETGEAYLPSSGAIIGIKADGHVIDNAATVDGFGYVVVTETEQMTAAPGKAVFELSIDDNSHGTANFIVLVEPKPSEGGILSDSDLSLLQEAIDSTSPAAIAEGVSDWMDEHLTPTTPVVDDTLTVQGAAADAKKTGDEIADLKSAIAQGGSFSAEVKAALDQFTASVLQLAEKVAYIDENGQDYYDDIDAAADALHSAMNPPVGLSYITAVYTQSGTVYTTDTLDSLKADLVVTAHYDNSTSEVVSDYVLTGTLTVGTSTITVNYGGKTTAFTVTVTERGALYPLENGTWYSEAENPVYQITVTNGKHVRFESLRGVSEQAFANLHDGGISASANIVNNLSELFVIPANTETTLTISNVVNSGGVSFNCNFRKANASTSSSFGIGDGTHTDGATVTQTLQVDESIGCLFFYHPQEVVTAGLVIEFDVSLFVGGTKYI